jgi:hypothetical protein
MTGLLLPIVLRMHMSYVIPFLLGSKWYQYRSIVRERCWIPANISRINRDSTFGATFQDEALLDLIDNRMLPDLFKNKRSDAATATDSNEEAECDYSDGSNYDKSDNLAEDDDWVCATLKTTSYLPPMSERARSEESPTQPVLVPSFPTSSPDR